MSSFSHVDIHYPTYSLTHTLCKEAKINQSAMFYRWEVAMPETVGSRPPFVEISDNTLFYKCQQNGCWTVYISDPVLGSDVLPSPLMRKAILESLWRASQLLLEGTMESAKAQFSLDCHSVTRPSHFLQVWNILEQMTLFIQIPSIFLFRCHTKMECFH